MTETAKSWEEILAAAAAAGPADDPLADPAEAELRKRLAEARALLDGLRPVKNPGRFLDPDAVEAAAVVREHDRPYFWRLKAELRPHKILRDWERAVGLVAKETGAAEIKVAEKTRLIALAIELLELWHDRANTAWCWPKEHGPGCCWRVQSKEARLHLLRAYGTTHQLTLEDGRKVPASPGKQAVAEAMDALEAVAYGGPVRPEPVLRVGGDGDRVVIDLCNDAYTVVVVDAAGWQVVKPSPIPMRRVDGMYPLPMPVLAPGDALGELRDLLGFTEHKVLWAQLVGFEFACLRPRPPYFLLGLFEEQGRGKTTTARILRQAVDPHEVERQPRPKSPDDLFVASYGQWLTVYDNLSSLSQDYSDAFCCISTEATYSKRELYSDFGVIRLKLARPQIVTAIVDVVGAADLLDRALVAKLPLLEQPVDDEELLKATEALAPRVLGQLLGATVLAIRNFAKTKLAERVRMVGPARWIEAAAPALGLKPGEFLEAYLESASHAHEIALEASVIGGPLRGMLDHRDGLAILAAKERRAYGGPLGFKGTAEKLLKELNEHTAAAPRPRGWPQSPKGLGGQLRRIAPALRKLGYRVDFGFTSDQAHERLITIDTELSYAQHFASTGIDRPNRPNRPAATKGAPPASDGSDGSDGQKHTQTNGGHSKEGEACPVCGEDASLSGLIMVDGAPMCRACAGGEDDADPPSPGFLVCATCNGLFPSSARGLLPEQRCPDCRRARAAASWT